MIWDQVHTQLSEIVFLRVHNVRIWCFIAEMLASFESITVLLPWHHSNILVIHSLGLINHIQLSGPIRRRSSGVDIRPRYWTLLNLAIFSLISVYRTYISYLANHLYNWRGLERTSSTSNLRRTASSSYDLSSLTSQGSPVNPGQYHL